MGSPLSKTSQQYYLKTMLHALHKSKEVTSKEIEPNTFHQKIFYTHEVQKNGEIDVQQIRSNDNLADLFTKALPTSTFKKLIYKVGMQKVKDVDMRGSMTEN